MTSENSLQPQYCLAFFNLSSKLHSITDTQKLLDLQGSDVISEHLHHEAESWRLS